MKVQAKYIKNWGNTEYEANGYLIVSNPDRCIAYIAKVARTGNANFKSYRFQTLDSLRAQVNKWVENIEINTAKKAQQTAERKAASKAYIPKAKLGTIFAHTWGYEAGFCDFYKVIEIKGNRAKLQAMTKKRDFGGVCEFNTRGIVTPGEIDESAAPFVKTLRDAGDSCDSYKTAYGYARTWDGKAYEEYNDH